MKLVALLDADASQSNAHFERIRLKVSNFINSSLRFPSHRPGFTCLHTPERYGVVELYRCSITYRDGTLEVWLIYLVPSLEDLQGRGKDQEASNRLSHIFEGIFSDAGQPDVAQPGAYL
ncbi:MAG: hypothetical protein ABWK05_07790 [Pyrobaculum sp.]